MRLTFVPSSLAGSFASRVESGATRQRARPEPRPRASRRFVTSAQNSQPSGGYSGQGASDAGGYSGGGAMGGGGGMQKIEYIIRPDGRVEEIVTGVKGSDCVKITEEINNKLGKVVSTDATPEYFEENVLINENIEKNIDTTGQSQW